MGWEINDIIMDMKKFVAVMNIPSPYRLHLLGELARQLKGRGIDFHCHFMAHGHKDRPKSWLNPKIDFPHTYWRDWGVGQYHFNPGMILRMILNPPEWLICGSSFDTFTGIGVQLFGRAKVKMCWLEGNTKTPGRMGGLIGWFKRFVMRRCIFAPVPGSDAAKYVALHRVRTTKRMPYPAYLPNLVDETRFKPRSHWLDADIVAVRRVFDAAPTDRVCLIPARLEQVKGLVPFFSHLTREMIEGWRIVLMGQGPLKNEILATLVTRGIAERVNILDYVPYDEMPKYYAAADLLLLPSVYDPNPLCVVEALHSGLPVALSEMAGNVAEAVTEGANGWVLHVGDEVRYAEDLRRVFASSQTDLVKMGKVSKETNSRFWNTKESIAHFIEEVVK